MAKVTFNLKDPDTKNKEATHVRMVFGFGKKHIILHTGIMIHAKYWNQKTSDNKFVRKSDDVNTINLNTRLKNIENSIMAAYNNHLSEHGALYTDRLKNEFRTILRPDGKVSTDTLTLIKGWQRMIDTLDPKSWTTKHYVTAKNVIERYELTLTQPLTFEDINMDFYNGFVQWCKTVPYKEQEKEKVKVKTFYALNSIGSHIKEVKVLMDYANDKGWTTNMGHRHKNFKVMEEEADSIALSVDEIYMIYNTDLSDDLRSDRIRDLYCIDLWTGLRYQDIQQVGPSKFLDKGTKIKLRTHKTNKTVIIPLHGMIKLIVEKYDGKLPKVPTDQEMNRQLKEIGRKAGLLERISKTTTRAGEKMSETFFQWELLTVHTARRSFATNAIRAGIPKRDVMDLTSHQTEKSFDKYVKIGAQETADRLQDHDFFKMRPILKVEQLTFSH